MTRRPSGNLSLVDHALMNCRYSQMVTRRYPMVCSCMYSCRMLLPPGNCTYSRSSKCVAPSAWLLPGISPLTTPGIWSRPCAPSAGSALRPKWPPAASLMSSSLGLTPRVMGVPKMPSTLRKSQYFMPREASMTLSQFSTSHLARAALMFGRLYVSVRITCVPCPMLAFPFIIHLPSSELPPEVKPSSTMVCTLQTSIRGVWLIPANHFLLVWSMMTPRCVVFLLYYLH